MDASYLLDENNNQLQVKPAEAEDLLAHRTHSSSSSSSSSSSLSAASNGPASSVSSNSSPSCTNEPVVSVKLEQPINQPQILGPKPRGRRKKVRTEPVRPICPQCEKQFSNQSALTKHKLTHSDERKFACHQCSKAFKRHDHLTGHMQTHSNRKPFNCTIQGCDKTYCDARSLRRHKENIHHIVAPKSGEPQIGHQLQQSQKANYNTAVQIQQPQQGSSQLNMQLNNNQVQQQQQLQQQPGELLHHSIQQSLALQPVANHQQQQPQEHYIEPNSSEHLQLVHHSQHSLQAQTQSAPQQHLSHLSLQHLNNSTNNQQPQAPSSGGPHHQTYTEQHHHQHLTTGWQTPLIASDQQQHHQQQQQQQHHQQHGCHHQHQAPYSADYATSQCFTFDFVTPMGLHSGSERPLTGLANVPGSTDSLPDQSTGYLTPNSAPNTAGIEASGQQQPFSSNEPAQSSSSSSTASVSASAVTATNSPYGQPQAHLPPTTSTPNFSNGANASASSVSTLPSSSSSSSSSVQQPSHLLRRRYQRLHSDPVRGSLYGDEPRLELIRRPSTIDALHHPHHLQQPLLPPPPLTHHLGSQHQHQQLPLSSTNSHHHQHLQHHYQPQAFSADYASNQHFFDGNHVNVAHNLDQDNSSLTTSTSVPHSADYASIQHFSFDSNHVALANNLDHQESTSLNNTSVPHSADSITDSGLGLNVHYEQQQQQPPPQQQQLPSHAPQQQQNVYW